MGGKDMGDAPCRAGEHLSRHGCDDLSGSLFSRALGEGADECELTCVARRVTTVRITDSGISEAKQGAHRGYGLRLVRNKRITSAFATDPDRLPAMIGMMMSASSGAYGSCEFWRGLAGPAPHAGPVPKTYDMRLDEVTCGEAQEIASRMISAASSPGPAGGTITGSLNIVSEAFEISNTSRLRDSERSTYIAGIINVDAGPWGGGDGAGGASARFEPPVSGMGHSSARTLDGFEPERAGRNARDMCLRSLAPVSVDCGEGRHHTIIFEPYSVGELLSFALSESFELKRIAEGRSFLSPRSCGDMVASDALSILDDPHAPDALGSHRIDAEGIPTIAGRHLVRSGRLAGAYSDLFGCYMADARRGDVNGDGDSNSGSNSDSNSGSNSDSNSSGGGGGKKMIPYRPGNASRMEVPMGRGADPIPAPAPHNLSVVPGDGCDAMPLDDLVAGVKRGLLVGRLWYTYAVNPTRGDFSCTARSGIHIIRNGRITGPAKPVRIMHSLPALLAAVSGVGDDVRNVVQWASLPSVTPSIRVDGVPVIPIY